MIPAYAAPAHYPNNPGCFWPNHSLPDIPAPDFPVLRYWAFLANWSRRLLASMFSEQPSVYRLVKDLSVSQDVCFANALTQQKRYSRAVAYFRRLARLSISKRSGEPLYRRQACKAAIDITSRLDTASLSYLYSGLGNQKRSDLPAPSASQRDFAKLIPAWQYRRLAVPEKREGRHGIAYEMYYFAKQSKIRSLDRLIQTYDEVSSRGAQLAESIFRASIRMANSIRPEDRSLFSRLESISRDQVDLEEHFLRPLTKGHPEAALQITGSLPAATQLALAIQHRSYQELLDRRIRRDLRAYFSLNANRRETGNPLTLSLKRKATILNRLSITPKGRDIALKLTARESDDQLDELLNFTSIRLFHDALSTHEPFVRRVIRRADHEVAEHTREHWTYQDVFLSYYTENGAPCLETTQRILRQILFARMSCAEQQFYRSGELFLPLLPDPANYTRLLKPEVVEAGKSFASASILFRASNRGSPSATLPVKLAA